MKEKLLIIFIAFTFCLLSALPAWAVSIGIKPTELNLPVVIGQETESKILVINTGEEPALYQVYPDDLADKITVKPADFHLEPGGSKIIAVIVKTWKPGKFSTNLSVVARPFGLNGIVTVPGIKVPITITSLDIPFWWIVLEVVVGSCAIIFFMIKLRNKKNKNKKKNKINKIRKKIILLFFLFYL